MSPIMPNILAKEGVQMSTKPLSLCPKCKRAEFQADAAFCTRCGTQLVKECSACHHPVSGDGMAAAAGHLPQHCAKCGHALL